MAYEVKLEVFEGPIDLLLHLITKQRVDIYEVSIKTITEEYVAYLGRMEKLDLEVATGFLVVAATLLELKSARLLPARNLDLSSSLLEERDLLLARLVECATYREAGAWLAAALRRGEAWHGRTVGLESRYIALAPELVVHLSAHDFAALAAQALAPRPERELDVSHVASVKVSVREAMTLLVDVLTRTGQGTFDELCAGSTEKLDVVVRFLALLELYKSGAVELSQFERFGDIKARWTGDVDPAALIEQVDEYTLEVGR